MTREEAIVDIRNNIKPVVGGKSLDIAIKALEQEPCSDAISRQAVLDIINFEDKWLLDTKSHNADTNIAFSAIKAKISELTSVTPQQRTGQWIEHFDEIGKWYECDQCHTDWGGPVNYCPNCGAKMEVEE